jgi:hypothetical protein
LHTGAELLLWPAVEKPKLDPSSPEAPLFARMSDRQIFLTALAFSPDGSVLATTGKYGGIRLWDVFAGEELLRLDGHEGKVSSLTFGPVGRTLLSAGDDGQALLWSLRPKTGPAIDPPALWVDLNSNDAAKAYRAMWAMSADPKAIALLREKIEPATPPDPGRVAKLIADLASDQFRIRETASMALTEQGRTIVPLLQEAVRTRLPAEADRRAKLVLDGFKGLPTPAEQRQLRAVRAVELAATADARDLLRRWAGGAPGATLTRAAADALKRLGP